MKSLLEQLNAHVKRQSISSTLNDPEMNEIIYHYDKYNQAREGTAMKEHLRQNLNVRIQQYKAKRKKSPNLPTNNVNGNQGGNNNGEGAGGNNGDNGGNNGGIEGDEEDIDDGEGPSGVVTKQSRTVKRFDRKIKSKAVRTTKDGFLIMPNGKKLIYCMRVF